MRMVLVVFLFRFLTAGAQEIKVMSFKNQDVDFREYETYFWAAQVDHQTDDDSFFLNDLLLKADIRNVVHGELDDRGYQLQEVTPDLIVNFRIANSITELNTPEDDARNYWREEEFFSTIDGLKDIKVEPGTLIISVLDREDHRLVWQAFASGLSNGKDFTKDEKKIREAVRLLFEEYGSRVRDYTRR